MRKLHKKILKLATVTVLLVTLGACADPYSGYRSDLSSQEGSQKNEDQPTEQPPAQPPVDADPGTQPKPGIFEPLAWEKTDANRINWSNYVHALVEKEVFTLLDGADDMATFCPKYSSATKEQKINFWGQLVAAIAKFESNWDPTMRYHESTMGNDPITKQPVYSEGLLQLSYQDIQWEPRCEFNWTADKNLAIKDPKKTILNPYKNLRCGLIILERQLKRHHRITIDSGVYWAVIKLNGKYQKISQIAAYTKALKFCQ